MKRKATFSPKTPKKNSSDHNSRKETPKYLIETAPNFSGNYYERIAPYLNDEQFKELAKKIYNEKFIERTGQNQKMQKKQVEALIKEVAITTEEYHGKEDIFGLFDMLKKEKSEENHHQKLMKENLLKPYVSPAEYKLPKKLKIKRKPKKENLDETGYHILELAGHYDEGHFVRMGKWEGLSYYPSRDIMKKDDGKWYIKSNELSERTDEEVFDVLADMSEFEKVFNYHWHVKFTDFNIETGLTARFSKREISGEGRLKKVAEYLGLRYVPEEKIPLEQGVKSIKEQHHIDRQNKYRQLMMKFKHIEQQQQKDAKIESVEQHLAKQVTRKHEEQRNSFHLQDSLESLRQQILELEETIKEKVGEITGLGLRIEELETKNEHEVQLRIEKEKDAANAEIAFNKLKKEFDLKTEQFKTVTSEKLNLEEKYNVLHALFTEEVQKSTNIEEANKELNNKISDLEKANLQYVANIQSKEEELNIAKQSLKNKEKENDDLKKEIDNLKGFVYSDQNEYKGGEKTGRKLTYRRLSEIRKKQINKLEQSMQALENTVNKLEPTGYEIEGYMVSKEVYDSHEKLKYKINVLEEKQDRAEERIESRDRMYDQTIEQYKEEITNLEALAYTGEEYPVEFDENDNPIKVEKETWKEVASSLQEDVSQRDLEIKSLNEELMQLVPELDKPEIVIEEEESYADIELEAKKKENENLTEVIYMMRDYDIPKSALEGDIEDIVKTVKEGEWKKGTPPQKNTVRNKSRRGFKPGR